MDIEALHLTGNIEVIGKLAEIKTKYNILIDYILENSRLSYNNTELNFDNVEKIIKALEPEKYDAKLDLLQAKENKE